MNSSVKKSTLFLSFVVLVSVFILLSPEPSSAGTVYCYTECGEPVVCGETHNVTCNTCCSEYSCWPCCPCCAEYSCGGSWTEYNASTEGCKPTIQKRNCWGVCSGPGAACCSCGGCKKECGGWEICEECGSWQKAERSCEVTRGGLTMPKCNKCDKDCLDKPSNPQYYDNPNYPTDTCNPEEGKNQNNIYLPVKLSWDDVKGWEDGWKENDCQSCSESCPSGCIYPNKCYETPECAQSYQIKIEGEMRNAEGKDIDSYEEILDKSEFTPPHSCFFKSNQSYQWQARACCGQDEATCGAWSEKWEFTTNAAPEPKLPYDPDWQGSEKAENLLPEDIQKLEWCEINDRNLYEKSLVFGEEYYRPLSYNILIYYSDQDLCHPQLGSIDQCPPELLSPDRSRGEKFPPNEFTGNRKSFFTKETPYAWKIAACKNAYGSDCSDYSQLWRFETGSWVLGVFPDRPRNDDQTPIGLPVVLKWVSEWANSFNYELIGIKSGKTRPANVEFGYPQLALNTVYSWKIQPCRDYEAKECEDVWGGPWFFKTTGQSPQLSYPTGDNIPLPVEFEWEAVGGAKSYRIKIQGVTPDEGVVVDEKTKLSLDYPELKQETDYTWQVKTCARENGNVCGEYSATQSFRTFKLDTPTGLRPEGDGEIYTYETFYTISWEPVAGARFYQFEVSYTEIDPKDPKSEECQGLVGKKIVSSPDNIVPRSSTSLPLNCWGDYQWQVKACLDISCQESGDYSSLQTFSFVAKEAPPETRGWGLVPCGRTTYDSDTPWDETERCQIKHIFIMFFTIIDFLLWKVIPLILVLLVLASGVIFYFSAKLEAATPAVKVKSLWRSAGIGLAIIFFAWTIISFFLTLFGYRIGAFGPWWQIF